MQSFLSAISNCVYAPQTLDQLSVAVTYTCSLQVVIRYFHFYKLDTMRAFSRALAH